MIALTVAVKVVPCVRGTSRASITVISMLVHPSALTHPSPLSKLLSPRAKEVATERASISA
jgi:hypothetical protein